MCWPMRISVGLRAWSAGCGGIATGKRMAIRAAITNPWKSTDKTTLRNAGKPG